MPIAQPLAQSLLSADLQAILRCLSCGSKLVGDQAAGFLCPACKRVYANAQGIARFVDAQHYAASFGFQWHRYQKTQLDHDQLRESERHFLAKTALHPEDLQGKLVLDVGCGMGRFAEVATRWGARVVGVDLSAAAEVAAKNLAERDFVAFQADVFALPFAPESFDVIYSIGVLHHTPDCEAAVKALDKYLKPGGLLVVWLYSGYNKWYRCSDFWRRYTHKLKPETLHRVLKVAVPFFYNLQQGLKHVPLVGRPAAGAVQYVFPVNRQPDAEARMLDTFDWYSPKYQSKHTYEQVFRWYAAMGMEDMRVGELSIAVRGRKPARAH
jgi:2-polyprenyl-3-methyl-5-hydroxy-6-metoxy-1,4-benzoquinol methylase